MPQEGDERLLHQSQTILKRNNLTEFPPDFLSNLDQIQLRTSTLPTPDIESAIIDMPALIELPD